MSDIDDIINSSTQGSWVKLDATVIGDHITGEVVSIKQEPRTDPEGNVVLSRKTQKPRQIYRVTFRVDESQRTGDEDTLVRKFDANESAQFAIRDALAVWRRENPTADIGGCKFAISIKTAAADSFSQADYTAKFGAPPAPAKPSVDIDSLV